MGVVRCRPFHDFTTETIVRTAIVTLAVICGVVALAAQQPTFKRTVLQQVDISSPGREAVTAFIEFQTGGSSGRHTHPGEEIGYVLDGSLSLEQEGKPAVLYKAGQAFAVPPNVVHNATSSGSTGARVLSTYIIEKGKPVATPVK
jgi:quercetin dioxygenase-like cupin family protein